VHYICVATIINLVLHFIFSLCCFLGFFLCHVVKFAGDELTICYRWSLGLLACQKVIQPLHPKTWVDKWEMTICEKKMMTMF
jgi:hypothetical protein